MKGRLLRQCLSNLITDHSDGNLVFDTPRNNQVGDLSLRRNVFVEIWLHIAEPLLDTTFDITTTLFDISNQAPRQAEIGVCIGKDFEVQQVQDAWVMQGEYSL